MVIFQYKHSFQHLIIRDGFSGKITIDGLTYTIKDGIIEKVKKWWQIW